MLESTFARLSALLCLWVAYRYFSWYYATFFLPQRIPPGPPPKFVIGNLLDMPRKDMAKEFSLWGQKYNSGCVYASLPGLNLLVLNKREDAEELLNKRSKVYSDRIDLSPLWNMIGQERLTPFLTYGDQWKSHRKIYQEFLQASALPAHYQLQTDGVRRLLRSLLDTPDDFLDHIKLFTLWLPLRLMYGYDLTSTSDPAIVAAQESNLLTQKYAGLGSPYLILGPLIDRLPDWMPGTSFKKIAKHIKHLCQEAGRIPWEWTQAEYAKGTLPNCVLSRFMSDDDTSEDGGRKLKLALEVCYTVYAGSAETTLMLVSTFVYAMAINPAVQRKAKEIYDQYLDGLGTPTRLPQLEDKKHLPYMEAIVRELIRWSPPGPFVTPHSTTQDDYYNGWFIPKGTAVIANLWTMTNDEDRYPNPQVFNPMRFLDDDGSLTEDDVSYVFGFGRRLCPGKAFGMDTLWITIASLLVAFDISPKKDSERKDVYMSPDMIDKGITYAKVPFVCDIRPRDVEMQRLVEITGLGKI